MRPSFCPCRSPLQLFLLLVVWSLADGGEDAHEHPQTRDRVSTGTSHGAGAGTVATATPSAHTTVVSPKAGRNMRLVYAPVTVLSLLLIGGIIAAVTQRYSRLPDVLDKTDGCSGNDRRAANTSEGRPQHEHAEKPDARNASSDTVWDIPARVSSRLKNTRRAQKSADRRSGSSLDSLTSCVTDDYSNDYMCDTDQPGWPSAAQEDPALDFSGEDWSPGTVVEIPDKPVISLRFNIVTVLPQKELQDGEDAGEQVPSSGGTHDDPVGTQ